MKKITQYAILLFSLFLWSCSPQLKVSPKEMDKGISIVDFSKDSAAIFHYFANGHLSKVNYPFKLKEKAGRKAGEIIRASDAQLFSGQYYILESPIQIKNGNRFSVDVYMDHLGSFSLKFEDSSDGGPTTSITIKNTKVNEWETLVFDFKDAIIGSPTYPKIAIFTDLYLPLSGKDQYNYFANIVQLPSLISTPLQGNKEEAIRIVVLGSSTAAGTGPSETKNAWVNRYRRQLQAQNGYNQVINLAVGGYTTYHLLPTATIVPGDKPQPDTFHNVTRALALNPDAIIINLPSNDAAKGFSIQEQLDNYRKIIKPIQQKNIPVWVSTTQGRNFERKKCLAQKVMRDSTYKMFGRKTLDFWTGFVDWEGRPLRQYDCGDGIHLNDEGHRLLCDEVLSKKIPRLIREKKREIVKNDTSYTRPLQRQGYTLVWQEEFDKNQLDTTIWSHELGDGCPGLCGWGNAEKVWYRPENTRVSDGKLIITAQPDWQHKDFWSSSRIITKHKKTFHFGRVDIRAKLPKTQGIWPAIWMLGQNRQKLGWPNCGEIDIMEERGQYPWISRGTLHYKDADGNYAHSGAKKELLYGNFSDDFHLFSMEWDRVGVRFFVDDEMYADLKYPSIHIDSLDNPFLQPFYLIINLAVGGNYLGYPDHTTVFPQTLEVDYVRYYLPHYLEKKREIATSLMASQYRMMTYNIRLDVEVDGENAWPNRKEAFVRQVSEIRPDIFGIQEGLPHQVRFINDHLGDYQFVGVARDGQKDREEYSAVFYLAQKFNLLDSGTFWLSETPDTPSMGWDAAYLRICTYAHFENKATSTKFWVFNTHLDNQGKEARREAARLLLHKIDQLTEKETPIILMGDFNMTPDDPVVQNLANYLTDGYIKANVNRQTANGTFNGFDPVKPAMDRIDYIFVNDKIRIKDYRVNREKNAGKYISDHFPVIVDVAF